MKRTLLYSPYTLGTQRVMLLRDPFSRFMLHVAVVTFSRSIGSAFQSSLLAIAGSIVGAALGILIIALLSGLSLGFSFMDHPITMVSRSRHLHAHAEAHRTVSGR